MPTKINAMFDNFNIQTWKKFLVIWKRLHDLQKKHAKQTQKKKIKKQKNRKKKIRRKPKIFMKVK